MDQPETEIPSRRPFRLIHGMALVAAAALMLSAERAVHWFWTWGDPIASFGEPAVKIMGRSLGLAGLSLVLLVPVLVQRSGRERLRRGAPGLVVHLVVVTVLVVRAVGWLARLGLGQAFHLSPGVFIPTRWTVVIMDYLWYQVMAELAGAIVVAWLVLVLVGRWNPERSWDDRLGRAVGVLWILYDLGAPLLDLLP